MDIMMKKKNKKFGLFILLLLFFSSIVNANSGYIFEDDKVFWENSYARLEVWPHTGQGIGKVMQNFNLTWKYPDNTIDICFRFESHTVAYFYAAGCGHKHRL